MTLNWFLFLFQIVLYVGLYFFSVFIYFYFVVVFSPFFIFRFLFFLSPFLFLTITNHLWKPTKHLKSAWQPEKHEFAHIDHLLRVNVAAAVNILSSTSSAFGNATAKGVDEKLQKKLLQEEEQAMQKLKVSIFSPK